MLISIGLRKFLESSYVDEILTPDSRRRAARFKCLAGEVGMLIRATDGTRVKGMIKLFRVR